MFRFIESIKLCEGQFYRLPFHQARVDEIFKLFFPTHKPLVVSELLQKEKNPNHGTYKCRIVFDQEHPFVELTPYTRREISCLKIVETDIEPTAYKSENREKINEAFAKKENCEDIIMLNKGLLSDASYSNIALWDGKNWCTPTLPVIYGTQRASLLKSKKIIERNIRKEDIAFYEKIRLFNAMIEFGEIELDCSCIL